MKVQELDFNNFEMVQRIDAFLANTENVDVKQTTEWAILRDEKKRYLYLENEKKQILFCSLAFEIYDNEVNDISLYIPRGPVFNDKYISFDNCIRYICQYAKNHEFKHIRLNPNINEIELDYNNLIKKGYNIKILPKHDYSRLMESYKEAILKIDNISKEELLENFHHKTRYNIRKSLRNNLTLEIGNDLNLKEFYKLYNMTAARHKFTPHPLEYFEKLVKIFKNKIVFCIVNLDEIPLAISINIKQSNTLFYLYGVSSDDNKNLYASYRMHYEMISYAKNHGFKYYNFGGVFSDEDDINNKDYGLLVFKSRFCYNGFTNYNPDVIIEI